MKLTTILLIIAFVQASAKGFSQKVTLTEKDATVENILRDLKQQTGYVFVTNNVDLTKFQINVDVKNVNIIQALTACFKGLPLDYKIVDKTVIIEERNPTATPKINNSNVRGTVVDETGKPLPGATVKVKGTDQNTVSDRNGNFSFESVPDNATLIVSFIGYSPKEISINGNLSSIKLQPTVSDLNDVVVVGYGTQKKVNLTGSVGSVSGSVITERPSSNLQDLLEGRIAGLTVVQPTGEPGVDQGSLQIRGLGTYGSNPAPLILIDGIAGTLSNLSPQDIDNVTVLKDAASASIYGSRAANGVILVTTKSGKRGTNTLEYDNSFGTTSATVLPDFITNSVTYMTMYNEALERSGRPDVYTQAQIDAYKTGNGSAQYPNTDWEKYYFHSAPIQNENLALSGGDSVSTYRASLGYQNQKSILAGSDYNRYNSAFNYTRKVSKIISIGTNTDYSYENIRNGVFTNDNEILLAYAQAPTFSPFLNDGSGRVAVEDYITNGTGNRTLYERQNNGFQLTQNYNVNSQAYINIHIIKGLDWKTTGAFVFYNQDYKFRQYAQPFNVYAFQPDANGNYTEVAHPLTNQLTQNSARDLTTTVNSTLNYQRDFGADHSIDLLAGYEQINNANTYIGADRYNYTNTLINEINGGPVTGDDNSGDQTQYALQSLFGRATYSYKQKYLLEGDIRYDGTSRVSAANRWGTFGGGSVGWRISEEDFIKKHITAISNLKLRASYGVLGNQDIYENGSPDYYPYQSILSSAQYPFSTSLSPGVLLTTLTDQDLHWEKTAITDVGLDLELFKGLFAATADWYYKNTTGILAQESDIPASVGLSPPVINAGAMVNKGFELQLSHQNHIGEFSYGVNGIFSLNRNKVTQALAPNPGVFQVGLPYGSYYIYVMDGIFNSQAEIDNSPKQPNSGDLKPGDIKIKDVNGNGVIDPGDRVSYSPYPSYTYSFGANVGWKGFRLDAFFQGVQGQKFLVNGWGIDPFLQGTAPTTNFLNAWTPQNHSQTTPAVYANGYPGVDGYTSTYFLKDASYLRLKNINLSYAFPKSMLRSIWIKGLTVFVSGDNVITWTKYPGEDPERAGSGRYAQFPQLKTYSAGLKVSL